ncbi:Uncharacterized protein TPAR_04779 [Tolypocladium paradoxum]|uniref:Uncharacterized protein n=1 Tax=Tolypocladium paradoxum TaxID=94208 RepID=A0A2S4KXW9_9HYPO|nr:Uncharacterized protein TPAR_04779 [Tolypocladium paradoxum]
MAPTNAKANYKTYEAQARMVRAIVAAHPDVKWNYKEIAACYGSDMTEHALNHRFRRLRAQATIIRMARLEGRDMKDMLTYEDLPTTQEAVDKNNIAKYFGQSTADGIQFQFRGIKKDADTLRKVAANGGDVANCLANGMGSAATTPSKAGTPSRGSRSGTARKRSRHVPDLKRSSSDEEEDDADDDVEENWSERDATPSKRPKVGGAGVASQKNATPRRAAQRANVTIADAAAQDQDSESHASVDTAPTVSPPGGATVAPKSLFGGGSADFKPKRPAGPPPMGLIRGNSNVLPAGFTASGSDVYMSVAMPSGSFNESSYHQALDSDSGDGGYDDGGLGDGEI